MLRTGNAGIRAFVVAAGKDAGVPRGDRVTCVLMHSQILFPSIRQRKQEREKIIVNERCPQKLLPAHPSMALNRITPRRQQAQLSITLLWAIVFCLLALGCSTQGNSSADVEDDGVLSGNTLRPVEEEQIENVVTDYFVRDSASPDYTVTIEEVDQNWARVSMSPIGVQNTEANIVYLQDQSATAIEAPTPDPDANPGNIAPVETTSGWTIIAGPQVTFSEEELDAAGIPPFIRE